MTESCCGVGAEAEAEAAAPLHRPQRHAALSRGVRHALRHSSRQLSWARMRALELGWSPDEQFTTIGAKNRRRDRPSKQVYVFPDAAPPRAAAALAQTQDEDTPHPHPGLTPSTTRLPYAHEGPFYVRVQAPPEPAEGSQDTISVKEGQSRGPAAARRHTTAGTVC